MTSYITSSTQKHDQLQHQPWKYRQLSNINCQACGVWQKSDMNLLLLAAKKSVHPLYLKEIHQIPDHVHMDMIKVGPFSQMKKINE